MSEPIKNDEVTEGGDKPNPSTEEKPKPSEQTPKPQDEQGASADLTAVKAQLEEVTKKLDRYKEQVTGSSEEASRLKKENETLQAQIKELTETPTLNPSAEFQKIMEEQGLEAAVAFAVQGQVASLQKKVDTYEKNESDKVLESFKETHKGLANPDVLEKFNIEFETLCKVYDDVEVAMEKAYLLVGGREAETSIETPSVDDKKKQTADDKVVQNVLGGDKDSHPVQPTVTNVAEIQKQIEDLQFEAMTLSNHGRERQSMEVLSKVEDLKARLGEKI